jgi:branched-chain amino acid transport system substrate-binding protein
VIDRRKILGGVVILGASGFGRAQVSNNPIVLGHSYPATGIFSGVGAEMKAALDAVVTEVNSRGINGRALKVISLDDGYDPQRTLNNAKLLQTQEKAVALIAPVGTANLERLLPWVEETGMPIIGARSGADSQREKNRVVFFNVASFSEETSYILRHLATLSIGNVALAAMRNQTGVDFTLAFKESLKQSKVAQSRIETFDPVGADAAACARAIAESKPGAVLIGGGGAGAIKVLASLIELGVPITSIYCMSILQVAVVEKALGKKSDGLVFSQVMPALNSPKINVGSEYSKLVKKMVGAQAPLSALGLEAYLSIRIAVMALQQSRAGISYGDITKSIERLGDFEIGGFRLRYGPSQHTGTKFVELGFLRNGRLIV